MFFTLGHFQPSLIFVYKAEACLIGAPYGAPLYGKQEWKGTVAYYSTALTTAVIRLSYRSQGSMLYCLCAQFMNVRNKHVRFSLVLCLRVRSEPTRVTPLSGAPLKDGLG